MDQKKDAQLKDIVLKGKMRTFQDLANRKDVFLLDRWRYSQLKHFVVSLPQQISSEDNMLPITRLCSVAGERRGISRIYKILIRIKAMGPLLYIEKRVEELGTEETDVENITADTRHINQM